MSAHFCGGCAAVADGEAVSCATHPRGVCRICGCRDDRACDGGCSWANEGHTICSTCQAASLLEDARAMLRDARERWKFDLAVALNEIATAGEAFGRAIGEISREQAVVALQRVARDAIESLNAPQATVVVEGDDDTPERAQ